MPAGIARELGRVERQRAQLPLGVRGIPARRGDAAGAGVRIEQQDERPIAVDDGRNGTCELGGHFVEAHDLGERRRQVEQHVRRGGVASCLLDRGRGVERGGRQARVRLEDPAFLGDEAPVRLEGAEPSVERARGSDVDDQRPLGADRVVARHRVRVPRRLVTAHAERVDPVTTRARRLEREHVHGRSQRSPGRFDDLREHAVHVARRHDVGDGELERLEPRLEQPRARLEVLGTARDLVGLRPTDAEAAPRRALELACLLDHGDVGEAEEARCQRQESRRPRAVLRERVEAVDETLAHHPLVGRDLLALHDTDRRHPPAAALGDLGEDRAGPAERLEHLGELGNAGVERGVARHPVELVGAAELLGRGLEEPAPLPVGAPRAVVEEDADLAVVVRRRPGPVPGSRPASGRAGTRRASGCWCPRSGAGARPGRSRVCNRRGGPRFE